VFCIVDYAITRIAYPTY